MKTLLRLLVKTQHPRNRSGPAQTDKGMTLVELLVGSIMAFLIITPMIGFVVDMLNTDRREQVKSNTEQDIQAAVNFIAQDLSQAIYIYDNSATGIPALIGGEFIPTKANETPILVFWKRQQIKNAVPVKATTPAPKDCKLGECNDAYVLSLVAYYQVNDQLNTWCEPSGGPCPTRIARYEIRDGVKNPIPPDPDKPYYTLEKGRPEAPHPAFNKGFDISKPTENVTVTTEEWSAHEVLVNYIDHSEKPIGSDECQKALGEPTTETGTTTEKIPEETLRIKDPSGSPNSTKGFYACVDTSKNTARVIIRGNSLRRIQTDADYDPKKSAYFPTASVQVQGRGATGK